MNMSPVLANNTRWSVNDIRPWSRCSCDNTIGPWISLVVRRRFEIDKLPTTNRGRLVPGQ